MKSIGIFLVVVMFFSSCFNKPEDRILASVNEKKLFLNEAIISMPVQIEDSAYFVEAYINKWIKKQLMIYHAEINLSSDLQNYDDQVEDYRSSLLIYAYQQELLNQKLDTTISTKEIDSYFDIHKKELKLNQNIFKGRFIIIEKLAPNINSLDKLISSQNEQSIDNLIDYCQQFAKEYYLKDNVWQYFSVFNSKIPNEIVDVQEFLSKKKSIWFEDETYRYYMFVREYRFKGSLSPLDLEKHKIRNILLNKNKIKYLKQLEEELYQNGLALKKIKIY